MIKRRIFHFLILEVLIAFILISLSILPFTSYPYRAFKKELSALEAMTMEPYFTESFNTAFSMLESESIFLEDLIVPFGKDQDLVLKRSVDITQTADKEKTPYSLITINVTISSKHYKKTRTKLYTVKSKEDKHGI